MKLCQKKKKKKKSNFSKKPFISVIYVFHSCLKSVNHLRISKWNGVSIINAEVKVLEEGDFCF